MILSNQLSIKRKSKWPIVSTQKASCAPAKRRNGNTELVPVLQEVADMSSPRFLVSGRC